MKCALTKLTLCIICLPILLSGCSHSDFPSTKEADQLFENNFLLINQAACLLKGKPEFGEWLRNEYEWKTLDPFLLSCIDQKERDKYFAASDMELLEALFTQCDVSGIWLQSEGPVDFYWMTSETNIFGDRELVVYRYHGDSKPHNTKYVGWFRFTW